jgi:hypothetical protein
MKRGSPFSPIVLIVCVCLIFSFFIGAKKVKKEPEPAIPESILDGLAHI